MPRPHDYDLEMGTEFEHPEHGKVEVVSENEWPITLVKVDSTKDEPEYYDLFEFETEELDI